MNKFYITTPIYYVNDKPHIGHAYTTLVGDIFARYYRRILGDENVFFLTGTDEHGLKIEQTAKKEGLSPRDFVDKVSKEYKFAWEKLGIKYDYFFRTTNMEHEKLVQYFLQKLYNDGYIYKSRYKGIYCVGCEKFLVQDEILNDKCKYHANINLIEQEEENYFLKLSDLSKTVLRSLEDDKYNIYPKERKIEILSKIKHGINDISISRTGVSWGIPIPWDQEHTVYVWVDALFNYLTATKIVPGAERFWPPDLHLMAKDILWFHSVVWEALLIGLDKSLPLNVFAHGFFSVDGQKMSKSLGNVINPLDLLERYGRDGVRYVLVSSFSFGNDGDFSINKFDEIYNADLANGIGNLVSRVARLCENSNFDFTNITKNFKYKHNQDIKNLMSNFKIDDCIKLIKDTIQEYNIDINNDKAWKLEKEKLLKLLESYVLRMLDIGYDIEPFLPETSERIIKLFTGGKIKKPEIPFFIRIHTEDSKNY